MRVGKLPWRATFLALAELAAIMSRDASPLSPRVKKRTRGAIFDAARVLPHIFGAAALGLSRQPENAAIAHESVVYFMQAIALLYGTDEERDFLPWAELAYLILAANEFVDDWAEDDKEQGLTNKEANLANTTRAMLFNRGHYQAHSLVRGCELLNAVPPRTAQLSTPETWARLQHAALGMDFVSYMETLAVPLAVISVSWGTDENQETALPIIAPGDWLAPTSADTAIGEKFLAEITWTRQDAVAELRRRVDSRGMVRSPSLFYRRPFVRIDERRIAAASPWVVAEQIRGAVWARHLKASKDAFGATIGAKTWFSAFGDLFELWTRRVSELATHDSLRMLDSTLGASDELEDVVFIEGNNVVLVSAKSRTIPEGTLKAATTRRVVRDWYEGFFFGDRTADYREGAVRLLDKKIKAIHASPDSRLPRRATIYPIIVTWDRMSTDNPGFTSWLDHRCAREELLQRCKPITVLQVDDYEELLATVAHGHSLVQTLERKLSGAWRHARFANFLRTEITRDTSELRLPGSPQTLDLILARIQARLFPGKT